MKRDKVRTAVLLLINGLISWWLIRLTIVEYSILSMRNLAFSGIAVLILVLGILLDWAKPSWGCAWNIAIWSMATVLQAGEYVHSRLALSKIGFVLALPITSLICLVYFMSWRDARRRAA